MDGRVLYKHRSFSDIWIEHVNGDWSILHESWKGTERSFAFFHGGCALEACKEKIMSVNTGDGFEEQPNVKMATGAEAKAQASGASSIGPHVFAYVANLRPVFFWPTCCTLVVSLIITASHAVISSLYSHQSPALFVTDCFGFLCLQAAVLAAAVAADNSRAEAIFISGATSQHQQPSFNGIFDPTGEKGLDGRVLYKNRLDPTTVIEHFGFKWQVKNVGHIGQDTSFAWVTGFCPFEACKSKVWQVANGGEFEDQPSVKMVTGAEAEAQASGGLIVAVASITHLSTSHSPRTSLHRTLSFPLFILINLLHCLSLIALVFFVCRPLCLLLLLQPTIPEPRLSSSAAQPARFQVSLTESLTQQGRRVWMAVFCTRIAQATAPFGSFTPEADGCSKMKLAKVQMFPSLCFEVGARLKTARRKSCQFWIWRALLRSNRMSK